MRRRLSTVAASTSYGYRVRAVSAAGNSAYSNTVAVTTPSSGLLSAPTGLTATAVSSSQINLQWTDNSGNESGFRIERSSNGSGFTQIAVTGPNSTSYMSAGLAKNRNYNYRVRATNASGDSAYSNTATAKTLK